MARRLTVIDDLPTFRGNPRVGEDLGPERRLDVKNFLRSLDCYLTTNNITDNAAKVRILNSQIDPSKGDANLLMGCYAGRDVTYDSVCEDFINVYPNFEVSDFAVAAAALLRNDLRNPEQDLPLLENQTRAAVDAYLGKDAMRVLRIGTASVIAEPRELERRPAAGAVAARVAAAEAAEAGAAEDGADEAEAAGAERLLPRGAGHRIQLGEVLQNLLLHLSMATKLPAKVYKQLTKVTPDTSSIKFMAMAINYSKKEKSISQETKRKKITGGSDEVLYAVRADNKNATPPEKKCYSCGKTGHFIRDCRVKTEQREKCLYCKTGGHSAKNCRKRQTEGVSYCQNCDKLRHVEKDCRSNCGNCKRKGHTRGSCRSNPERRNRYGGPESGRREQVRYLEENFPEDAPDYDYDESTQEDASD